ncbi:Cytochrome P450 4F12 (CYPIVF12) [Durusdinium trenchii]|uniref:Cytochrome P450 4F12 (CYPIVF12) n=1 Tax=Durusdinium trenchii TaxID=1381693 RepID=A0ABP0JW93_9DINO
MDRVKKLSMHLTNAAAAAKGEVRMTDLGKLSKVEGEDPLLVNFDMLEKWLPAGDEYDVANFLAGPLQDRERYPGGFADVFRDLREAQRLGRPHVLLCEWQKQYGGKDGLSSNIVVPHTLFMREHGDEGKLMPPVITQQVIISHPDDAMRLARLHVMKQPAFNMPFYGSIISTIDNDYWRMQREQLVPAFLPEASLGQIFDVSLDRAAKCADRLWELSEKGSKEVDMSDFLLFETKAQLQLALFGETQEFMEETNEKFRRAMQGQHDPGFVRPYCRQLGERFERPENTGPQVPEDVAAGKCPVARGPLSRMLADMKGTAPKSREGNALIFAFAGHDTTGLTLSHMMMELALHPHFMKRLQAEIDGFLAKTGDRKLVYSDLKELPFLTRCFTETLRLHPAVANGTFRQMQYDEEVHGPNGTMVKLPKGTMVQINNYSRHRNPDLWGPDVNEWNPDRDFRDGELWHGQVLAAYNPQSERFSPFTFTPRDCIGKNFAQLEARLIAIRLLSRYDLKLPDAFVRKFDRDTYESVNYGTAGPRDPNQADLVSTMGGFTPKNKIMSHLPMKVLRMGGDESGALAVDWVWATRAGGALVLCLWVSRRFDAFLMVALVSTVASATALQTPGWEAALERVAPALPGVSSRLDLVHVAQPVFETLASAEIAAGVCGLSLIAVSAGLGWVVSRKSPVSGLLLYIVTFICIDQSGFLDGYPIRLVVPVVLVSLSIFSRHIRYLNLSAAVFAIVSVARWSEYDQGDLGAPEVKDVVPLAFWMGFALLLVHDVLVRLGVVEWTTLVAESAVLVFNFVVLVHAGLLHAYALDISTWGGKTILYNTMTWEELLRLDCFPECVSRFESVVPGVFCTLFGVVTIMRNIIGGRSELLRGVVSLALVTGGAAAGLAFAGKSALLLRPNVTSVISAVALVVSERMAHVKVGFSTKETALQPQGKRVGYHVLIYWADNKKVSSSNAEADQRRAGKHVSFDDQGNASKAKLPSDRQMEHMWAMVDAAYKDMHKAKTTYKHYQKLAFKQEAVAKGIRSYDEASTALAKREAEKAKELSERCRQASADVKKFEREAKSASAKAKAYEEQLQQQKQQHSILKSKHD